MTSPFTHQRKNPAYVSGFFSMFGVQNESELKKFRLKSAVKENNFLTVLIQSHSAECRGPMLGVFLSDTVSDHQHMSL